MGCTKSEWVAPSCMNPRPLSASTAAGPYIMIDVELCTSVSHASCFCTCTRDLGIMLSVQSPAHQGLLDVLHGRLWDGVVGDRRFWGYWYAPCTTACRSHVCRQAVGGGMGCSGTEAGFVMEGVLLCDGPCCRLNHTIWLAHVEISETESTAAFGAAPQHPKRMPRQHTCVLQRSPLPHGPYGLVACHVTHVHLP